MLRSGFGHTLREARLKKGMEFNVAARRLRIRPDILRAIEEENFEQMPPRGYARNMINSYARMLGLNATDVTRAYLDAQQHYDDERRRANARPTGFDMNAGRSHRTTARNEYEKRTGSAFVRSDDQLRYLSERARKATDGSGAINGLGRRVYTQEAYSPERESQRVARATEAANRAHRQRYRQNANDDYLSVYGGTSGRPSHGSVNRGGFDLGSLLAAGPVVPIVAGIAVLLAVVLVVALVFLGPKQNADNVDVMPEISTSTAADEPAKAPTDFTFEFTIDEGTSKWCEVHIDGKTEYAKTVNGPHTESFQCTGKLKFVCYGTNGVTVTVDGDVKKLKAGKDGLCNYSVSLKDVLSEWAKNNTAPSGADKPDNDKDFESSNSD